MVMTVGFMTGGKNGALRVAVCVWSLFFAVLPCGAQEWDAEAATRPPFVLMIDDFEAPGAGDRWGTEGGAIASVVPAPARGGHVMRFLTDAYRDGPQRWPLMKLSVGEGLPADWTNYDELVLDVKLTAEQPIRYGICVVAGEDRAKYYTKPKVDPGSWQTIRHRVRTGDMDPRTVRSLRLYITEPAEDIVLDVDNVRLESVLLRDLRDLHEAYLEIGDGGGASEVAQLVRELASGNVTPKIGRTRLEALRSRLRSSQLSRLRTAFAESHPGVGFAVSFADSMVRVMPRDHTLAEPSVDEFGIELARGEREAFQVVVIAPETDGLEGVSVTALPFVHSEDAGVRLPAGAVRISPVGFVRTRPPRYHTDYVGWYPDPILEFLSSVSVQADEMQPFWVRVYVEARTPAGVYRGAVRVTATGAGSVDMPVEVRVRDFAVPATGHLPTAISLYGHALLSRDDMARPGGAYDWILSNYRLNPFSIYSDSAYGKPRLFPMDEYLRRLPMGLNAIPLLYLKLPRQALYKSVKESREAWAGFTQEQKSTYPEAAKQKVLETLRERVPQFRDAGLLHMTYCYGFDEAKPDEWPAVVDLCNAVNAEFPDLRIISTAYDPSYGTDSILGNALDGWIPHDDRYNPELAGQARKLGRDVWWYSTSMFIDRKPLHNIRSQMGFHAFKLNVDGWLYWTVTRWAANDAPITDGPYTNWDPMSFPGHNGGGSFTCCGPVEGELLPTIRLENIRDGLEDYEYLWLLREQLSSLPADSPIRARAERALNIGKDLVDGPAGVAADYHILREKRREIAVVLETLSQRQRRTGN